MSFTLHIIQQCCASRFPMVAYYALCYVDSVCFCVSESKRIENSMSDERLHNGYVCTNHHARLRVSWNIEFKMVQASLTARVL